MKLTNVATAAKLCFASNVTLTLVGTSGCGKTSIWSQIYEELGFDGYHILRPSLLADAADLIGLPEFFEVLESGGKVSKTTKFMRPDWLPNEGDKTLIIIDEYNRISKDVANAIFGLIEAEQPTVGDYVLPKGCKVVATGNPPTDNYAGVMDFNDSAWTSRMCFVKIAPDLDVYTAYGRKTGKVSDVMLNFLNKNEKYFGTGEDFEVDDFFGSTDEEKGAHIKNNTRSKTKVSDLYEQATELGTSRDILFECIRGIGGLEFATSFMTFADNYSNLITVDDIMTDDDAHNRFDYNAISSISKVLEDLKFKITKNEVKDEHLDNVINFMLKIPLDTLQGFVMHIVDANGEDKNESEFLTNFADKLMENEELDGKLTVLVESKVAEESEESENEDS